MVLFQYGFKQLEKDRLVLVLVSQLKWKNVS
jgi:hypothetical protein